MFARTCAVVAMACGISIGATFAQIEVAAAVPDRTLADKPQLPTSVKENYIVVAQRRGGGHARSRGARPSPGNAVNRDANINRNRPGNANINRNTNVNRNGNVNLNNNRNANININRNVNVTVRDYGWRGARWGAVAFGVTMGTVIVVAANTPPPPPHPTLCWTWTNAALTKGYWYYCSGP